MDVDTGGDWHGRMIPLMLISGQLVRFGRYVSKSALIASIYDFMVKTLISSSCPKQAMFEAISFFVLELCCFLISVAD
ncbi:hypothetical protein HanIR_Chr17g0853651 [Helianthus annuus]|nr:hypothetical protein HanIR_Chr17g0853651 [Helianthus annuus]